MSLISGIYSSTPATEKTLRAYKSANKQKRKIKRLSRKRQLPSNAYHAYLASDIWKAKRRLALYQSKYQCQDCRSGRNLEVHHLTYARLGMELPQDLLVLCRRCHAQRHNRKIFFKPYPAGGMPPSREHAGTELQAERSKQSRGQ